MGLTDIDVTQPLVLGGVAALTLVLASFFASYQKLRVNIDVLDDALSVLEGVEKKLVPHAIVVFLVTFVAALIAERTLLKKA